jgi:hypothetical protein
MKFLLSEPQPFRSNRYAIRTAQSPARRKPHPAIVIGKGRSVALLLL